MFAIWSKHQFKRCLGFLILVLPLPAIPAPSITGVYISADTGRIIIDGANFSEGPNVVLFDNFEQGSDGQIVPLDSAIIGSWSTYGTLGRPRYTYESEDGLGYFIRDFERPLTDGNRQAQLVKIFDKYEREIYFSFSVMVPPGHTFAGASAAATFPSVSSWKFSWLMSGSTGYEHGDGQFDICVPTHVGDGSFLLGGNDGNLTYISGGSQWWDWNGLNDLGFYIAFDQASPASGPVQWLMEITSGKHQSVNVGEVSPTKFNNTDNRFDRINFSGWWGNGSLENFSGVYDNIYIATGNNSKSRVLVTNSKFRSESTRTITIPPVAWSSNRIEIDENLIPNWSEVYFHISDSDGNLTNEGLPICPNCPSPVQPQIQ